MKLKTIRSAHEIQARKNERKKSEHQPQKGDARTRPELRQGGSAVHNCGPSLIWHCTQNAQGCRKRGHPTGSGGKELLKGPAASRK